MAVAAGTLVSYEGLANDQKGSPEPKRIEDNSFLLEEAYNQEPGVIQHIQAFQYMKNKTWGYTFTEEWPVPGQTHQVSITVPVARPEIPELTGIGDILLNYRYQLLADDRIAVAPRLSAVLPTGDYKNGLGGGAIGVQGNMPVSLILSPNWVNHWNAGFTLIPSAKAANGVTANTLGFNYGTSFIYLFSETFNLMFEFAGTSSESVQDSGETERNETFFVNPGVRFAINFDSGLQIVPGLSLPLGIGPSADDRGFLLYLSFEHPMF
ncbi:MAG: hypothetical protein A2070_01020 [Bdellovibrionales bacterium GWC1_52_8]|nr:MAG: hypothetical protein A2X97_12280 [Bdellovibrionales bacterium GWA1_52_35]OFZ39772.1 MAG: hypothetical protein A2070_01020 [Bdellovibrionales bacterium GWC1_52_8]